MEHSDTIFGGHGMSMSFWWIVIIVVILVGARWLYKSFKSNQKNDDPLEVLKKRYANGEIDKEEFEKMKKDILN